MLAGDLVRDRRPRERHLDEIATRRLDGLADRFRDFVRLPRREADLPLPIADGDEWSQADDPRYATLPPELKPRTECLKDVLDRALPYWYDEIVPDLRAGKTVLVAAHGNSLRALVKHLDGISDEAIAKLNIPTGIPLVYELDAELRPQRHYYLGDQEAIAAAMQAVANQGRAKTA